MIPKFICEECGKIILKKNKSRHLDLCINIKGAQTGGDLESSKLTSTLLKPFTYEKYPGERHLFKHNYTGPGTRLDLRLDENLAPKPGEEPINKVDEAALKHDIAYNSEDLRDRHIADVNLIHDLNNIQNPTTSEKLQKALVKLAMKGKIIIGQSVAIHKGQNVDRKSKIVNEESDNDELAPNLILSKELHKEYRKPKHFRKVIVYEKDDIWSADLIFQGIERKGKHVILTVIDLYTQYAFVELTNRKTGPAITKAFEKILTKSFRTPNKLWVDKGKEFYNKDFKSFCKNNNIEIYSTENQGKAVVIERFNRTFKNRLFKHFTAVGNQDLLGPSGLELLEKIVNDYNNTIHSTINISPQEASMNPDKINIKPEKSYKENLRFKIGDRVRITKIGKTFPKGYTFKWSKRIYVITKILNKPPFVFEISNLNGNKILGRFYSNELQKSSL